ncbi:nuclear transport factor 2 family protein [Roseobacter sp.]|uniref:nuclear transport factor 2 family protein n=1 Tax=Roseobacter sp. TaxID=1907202 RepID=UPI0025FDE1DA|nr:nuclear transport factor 2 family protein [Roseobacter sp.]
MEDLVETGRKFVQAMRDRQGITNVDDMYAETAESIEAVVPPKRYVRVSSSREAIKAKREDWLAEHEIHRLDADGPYVHPPNRFAVRFDVDATQKATGRRMNLREIAVYSVEDGRIVREEFFMAPK